MSKYIKKDDAIYVDCILMDEIECKDCSLYDEERNVCRMVEWLESLPTIEVSEDCVSRKWLEEHKDVISYTNTWEETEIDECVFWKNIENAPSVVPTNENEIKLCRNCDNAYVYQDCLYCDEIEEETEIEPDDACSLWKLRESVVKPKEGEWYRQTTDHFDYWECSECGMGVGLDDIKNFCPNCGAKMKEVYDEQI